MAVYIMESSQSSWHNFNGLEKGVKKLIQNGRCINCEQPLKDPARIDYVTLKDKLIWWHWKDDSNHVSSCIK